jgi:hypothetical protein
MVQFIALSRGLVIGLATHLSSILNSLLIGQHTNLNIHFTGTHNWPNKLNVLQE